MVGVDGKQFKANNKKLQFKSRSVGDGNLRVGFIFLIKNEIPIMQSVTFRLAYEGFVVNKMLTIKPASVIGKVIAWFS